MSTRRAAAAAGNNEGEDESVSTVAFQFALTPGTFDAGPLNFAKSSDNKLYKSGASKLPVEIDCKPGTLKLFLSALQDRSIAFGWDSILDIPDDIEDADGPTKNLLTEYGRIDLDHLREHVETYADEETRQAQNSMMLFQCLKESLTDTARAKVLLHSDDYITENKKMSGALLLKVIIRESYNDTNATVTFIRERLSSLDTYIKSIDSDIDKFNQYVHDQLMSLNARGESTHDLLSNLFKGYAAASDRQFVAYIMKKKDEYDEGQNIEPNKLMQLALNKYQTLVEGGKWNAPTDEEAKIIALEAEIKKMKSNKKGKQGSDKAKAKAKSNKMQQKQQRDKPKWMMQAPKDGEPTKKTVSDKIYYWCPTHNAWVRHKPKDCKGLNSPAKNDTSQTKDKNGKEKESTGNKNDQENRTIRLSQAMTTILEDEDQE